jgi:uncharacterized protein YqgQ
MCVKMYAFLNYNIVALYKNERTTDWFTCRQIIWRQEAQLQEAQLQEA